MIKLSTLLFALCVACTGAQGASPFSRVAALGSGEQAIVASEDMPKDVLASQTKLYVPDTVDASLSWIVSCTKLVYLRLDRRSEQNPYTDDTFLNISKLVSLRRLDLSMCVGVNFDRLQALAKLGNLEELNLSYSRDVRTERLIASPEDVLFLFNRIPSLKALDLSGSVIKKPSSSVTSRSMLLLRLCRCSFEQGAMAGLDMSAITELVLDGAELDDEDFQTLGKLMTLERLSLGSRKALKPSHLEAVAALPRLRALSLAHIPESSDVTLEPIQRCRQLEYIDLSMLPSIDHSTGKMADIPPTYRVSVATCQRLATLSSLRDIVLRGPMVKNDWIAALAKAPRLSSLDLSYCESLSVEGFRQLSDMPQLRALVVEAGYWKAAIQIVTDEVCTELAKCKQLSVLDVSYSTSITASGVSSLSKMLWMRSFSAMNCPWVEDSVVLGFTRKWSACEALHLSDCTKLTSKCAGALDNMENLQYLDLSGCPKVDNEVLGELLKVPRLSQLFLDGTAVAGEAYEVFKGQMHRRGASVSP